MSRRKPTDNSASVSLFPFLAVLLCTMGALLVVLVAVSRAARESALREGATRQQVTAAKPDPKLRAQLERIEQHNEFIGQLRSQAQQQLRSDQVRLSHLENHMRQLQDQLAVLQAAAAELDALEEEHYDDREQAQREIERLERLVAETRAAVAKLKEEMQGERRSYALIPYEGRNGTFRRPIYIECQENELVLQPEGTRVLRNDLYPPYGAGNPLAAAIRAARDYHMQLHPAEGASRDTEPYPLLVVRPKGLVMYEKARRALESSDMEFGFELAEDDWELKYPVADPKLAILEQQAIDLARIRQKALAAAAPRAYRHASAAMSGEFEFGDDGGEEIGFGDEGGGESGAFGASAASNGTGGEFAGDGELPEGGTGAGGGDQSTSSELAATSPNSPERGDSGDLAGGTSAKPSDSRGAGSEGTAAERSGSAASASSQGGAGGESSIDPNAGQQVNVSTGNPPPDHADTEQPSSAVTRRGRDWALDRKKQNAVPIRRSIEIVVGADHITILHDDANIERAAPAGKQVELDGDTVESLDHVVAAVRAHIEGWGFAGDGMYWRPVLIVNIGPGGQRRADDLNRLLKNSGIELRAAQAIRNQPQGNTRATR